MLGLDGTASHTHTHTDTQSHNAVSDRTLVNDCFLYSVDGWSRCFEFETQTNLDPLSLFGFALLGSRASLPVITAVIRPNTQSTAASDNHHLDYNTKGEFFTVCRAGFHLFLLLRDFLSPFSSSSGSLPLPPFFFLRFFVGRSSSESSLTNSSMSGPFLRCNGQESIRGHAQLICWYCVYEDDQCINYRGAELSWGGGGK